MNNIKNLIKKMGLQDLIKANELAEQAGLNKAVFHGTKLDKPFDVIDKNKLGDALFHVAPTDKIPTQRLMDINQGKGTIMPLRAKIENPLDVGDLGDWSPNSVLGDYALKNMMNKAEKNKMSKLGDLLSRNTDDFFVEQKIVGMNPTSKKLHSLMDEGRALEQEKASDLYNIINKRGFDALRYKNNVEIPEAKRLAMMDLQKRIRNANSKEEIEALNNQYLTLANDEKNTSYALFPDKTPIRRLDNAGFKDVLTKPNYLTYGAAGAALLPGMSEASTGSTSTNTPASKFKNVMGMLSPEEVDTLTEPSVMDEHIKQTDPEQYAKLERAKRIKEAVDMGMGLAGGTSLLGKKIPRISEKLGVTPEVYKEISDLAKPSVIKNLGHLSPENIQKFEPTTKINKNLRYDAGNSVFGNNATYFDNNGNWINPPDNMRWSNKGNVHLVDAKFNKLLGLTPEILQKMDPKEASSFMKALPFEGKNYKKNSPAAHILKNLGVDGINIKGFDKLNEKVSKKLYGNIDELDPAIKEIGNKFNRLNDTSFKRGDAIPTKGSLSELDKKLREKLLNNKEKLEKDVIEKTTGLPISNDILSLFQDQLVNFAPEKTTSNIRNLGNTKNLSNDKFNKLRSLINN